MAERTRERIDPATGADERYVRRDERGRFTSDQVEVGRSLTTDRRQRAKTTVKKGHGDDGDQAR
jgi:hypothetical protein